MNFKTKFRIETYAWLKNIKEKFPLKSVNKNHLKRRETNQQNPVPRIHLSTALLIAVAGKVIRQIRKSHEVRLKIKISMTESKPAHRR